MPWYLENGEDFFRTSDSTVPEERLRAIESERLLMLCSTLEREGWTIVTLAVEPPRYIPPGLCGQHWTVIARRDTPIPEGGITTQARRRLGLRGADIVTE